MSDSTIFYWIPMGILIFITLLHVFMEGEVDGEALTLFVSSVVPIVNFFVACLAILVVGGTLIYLVLSAVAQLGHRLK